MTISHNKLPWLAIPLVSGLCIVRQFTNPHFASCVIDDSILQMSWVRQFSQVLSEGTWLPRWLPDSNGGYGSPVFVFYSPLVYYVSALIYWMTGSVVLSMKLVRGLGLCLSGFSMLAYAKRFVPRNGALIVALVYLSLPFHILGISYWSLYAETWAWIWFPLILYFLSRLSESETKPQMALAGFALCYAGLILTHLVSAYMFSFVILAYVVIRLRKGGMMKLLARSAFGIMLGLGLAAFFLGPAWYERQFVHLEYSTLLPEFNFRNTFLFFPNPDLTSANPFQARTLWLLLWIALLQTAMALLSIWVAWKSREYEREARRELILCAGIVAVCLFLMSKPSVWLWDAVPGLPQVQFSTRWLSILTLAAALPTGMGINICLRQSSEGLKWVKLGQFSLVIVSLAFSVLIIARGCFLGDEEERLAAVNAYNAPEYNPRTMPHWNRRAVTPADPQFSILSGNARVRVDNWQAHMRHLWVNADSPTRLQLRTLGYPGWIVTLNGEQIACDYDPATGGIVMELPIGQHDLRMGFYSTPWRRYSLGISCAAILLLMAGGGWAWRQRQLGTPSSER